MTGAVVDASTVVNDRYRIVRGIGSGTMGTVYEVEHLGFGRRLAMKVLHSQANQVESLRRRFEREAYSAGRLNDPRIVDVTDVGQLPDGRPYIIMGLVDGRPLTQEMERGPMSVSRAVQIARGILEGLAHAHKRGVIHRDLKPDNVMLVSSEPNVKLLDFGLARLIGPKAGAPLTNAGAVFGTPRYMAPEQAMGEAAEARSDLYSVGILLYEMITGRPLFPADTALEAMRQQMSETPPPLVVQSDGTFDAKLLAFVVEKALKKHPDERFADANGFIGALDAVMIPPTPRRIWPWLVSAAAAAAIGMSIYAFERFAPPEGNQIAAVQEAIRIGRVQEASDWVSSKVRREPGNGTNWLAMAVVRRAQNDDAGATRALAQTLRLQPTMVDEPVLRSMVRDLVSTRSTEVKHLLKELGEGPDPAWLPLLTELAQTARRLSERRRAWEVLETLGEYGTLDPFVYLSEQLERNPSKNCSIRAWYVRRLIALQDRRVKAIAAEEKARPRRQRACMEEELAAVLAPHTFTE
ncbi:MAG: serine/threonine-protein kinase [Myxococcota bacterium]